ncbi:unnamed protein product [Thelazia callipaeda]|uniref:Smg4_UPF3 domain-containing protein n=1 Tax=Thelazia callipaeda TaxID=103827 RepID=A0A0N5CZ84_THECL|nr:unnamed protein product [Thelazia callipaeda]
MVSVASCSKKGRNKRKTLPKIVLRRLPAAMTWDNLQVQLSPVPDFEFVEFIAAKRDGGVSFSRVYFVFKNDDDILTFRDRFHGYVFIDDKGGESVGIVELAPNPKVPYDNLEDSKKRDPKCGTVESGFETQLFIFTSRGNAKDSKDQEYKKFLVERKSPEVLDRVPLEVLVREIEEKEKTIEQSYVQETPLTQYMDKKGEERIKRMQERRRTREEEKYLRSERRRESEKNYNQEQNDAKKVVEFRNSKFERSSDAVAKEYERSKMRTQCFGDRIVGLDSKDVVSDRLKHVELKKRVRNLSASEECSVKKIDQNEKVEKSQTNKIDDTEKINKPADLIPPDNVAEAEQVSRAAPKISNITIRGARNNLSGVDVVEEKKVKNEKAVESDAVKPRRNKDRPERAIYQPGAARRRAAVLAASDTNPETKTSTNGKTKA